LDKEDGRMKTITAAAAKNAFGKFLDMARWEQVVVTKNDRPVGVFMSMEDLEDTVWGERALKAHHEGYIGPAEREKLLDRLIQGED
jgi:prevent-host-death family protein